MKVLVLGAYSYDDGPTIQEDICVDGVYHATRLVDIFNAGPEMEGGVVREYQDIRLCDGSCGISTMPTYDQAMFERALADTPLERRGKEYYRTGR